MCVGRVGVYSNEAGLRSELSQHGALIRVVSPNWKER